MLKYLLIFLALWGTVDLPYANGFISEMRCSVLLDHSFHAGACRTLATKCDQSRQSEDHTSSEATKQALDSKPSIQATTTTTIYGPNNFGDIMGDLETNMFVSGDFSPFERVVLTANGNLQRILSAYYGAPISVAVKKCEQIANREYESTGPINSSKLNSSSTTDCAAAGNNPAPLALARFDREVDICVKDQVVCTAKGEIAIYDEDCLSAISEGRVGVGQLFRYLKVLPTFNLLRAGRTRQQQSENQASTLTSSSLSLWREYELACPQLHCRFIETFTPDFLDILS